MVGAENVKETPRNISQTVYSKFRSEYYSLRFFFRLFKIPLKNCNGTKNSFRIKDLEKHFPHTSVPFSILEVGRKLVAHKDGKVAKTGKSVL